MQRTNPLAVTGLACRLPGAGDVDTFWSAMMRGDEPVRRLGPDRWSGLVDGVDGFDSDFFGVPDHEAVLMDPQQRMLLEVVHDAIASGGQSVGGLAGSPTGVFVAQHGSEYAQLQRDAGVDDTFWAASGTTRAITSGRISHTFDLRGPSMTIDTACSSSLVAVHLAAQSIASGECRAAIVAGVNLVLLPALHRAYAGGGLAARDGRCKFGDAAADGFVRSDGVVAILLRPLSDARAAGDAVRAVVRGSAVNHGGRSSGRLHSPSGPAQEALVREACLRAGVAPGELDYVEAHGAGTAVGDAVELAALNAVLADGRPAGRRCLVGSAKATVGHTESAAGLVGLVRAVLCLERGVVPAARRPDELNPALLDPASPLELPVRVAPLPRRDRPALAGVNSFGVSGTNAHVVLEAPPAAEEPPVAAEPVREVLLTLSARSAPALDDVVTALRSHLVRSAADEPDLLARTARDLAERRDHHEHRCAVVVGGVPDAVAALDDGLRAVRGVAVPGCRPLVGFVFSGHGSAWTGMARELLGESRGFAAALLDCDRAVREEAGFSVLEELTCARGGPGRTIEVTQPVLFAVQVALARTWLEWGVVPDVVIGHSIGEIAAAHIAGALDLDQAAAVVCRRSRVASRLSGRGGMLSVRLSGPDAERLLDGDVAVAVRNGDTATVLSGAPDALDRIARRLRGSGIAAERVEVDIASHSPQMDEVLGELRTALAGLSPRSAAVPIRSTVLAERVDGATLGVDYWVEHLRRPVRFAESVDAELAAAGERGAAFVEISPRPLLGPVLAERLAAGGRSGVVVPSLRRDRPERRSMLDALARLYVAGVDARGDAVAGPGPRRRVPLPAYPWQHRSHWLDAPAPPEAVLRAGWPAGAVTDGPGADRGLRADPPAAAAPPAAPRPGAAPPPAVAPLPVPPPRPPVSPGPAAVPAEPQEQRPGVPESALRLVRRLVAEALHCPEDRVRDDAPLDDLGLDSLGAVDLIAAVGAQTGVRLAERELGDGATTVALARTVAARLGAATPSGSAPG